MTQPTGPRIGRATRRQLRECLSDASYLREIANLFDVAGFTEREPQSTVSGQRRTLVESYYSDVDWQSPDHTQRILGLMEQVLWKLGSESQWRADLLKLLEGDGFAYTPQGHLVPRTGSLGDEALSQLRDTSAIWLHLKRIEADADERPEEVIGAAKDLIEATVKHVLEVRGESYHDNEKMPSLIARAQQALALHPQSVAPDAKGGERIIKILGASREIAVGIAELRSTKGYGTGHGHATRIGVAGRHARLAARTASAYVGLLLETLGDENAPWRGNQS